MVAVLVGEGVWGLIVSLTNNLILPFVARTMGADPQSSLYLGKGDFNFPALFTAILELCFAGIVAVALYSWTQQKTRLVRRKSTLAITPTATMPTIVVPTAEPVAAVPAPPAKVQAAPTPIASPVPASPGQFWSPPQPAATGKATPPPPPAKPVPAKPKAPKQIYYNIVGEPMDPEDDG